MLSSDGLALTGLWFVGQEKFGGKYKNFEPKDFLDIFNTTKQWLNDYFNGKNPKVTELKLNPVGSDFQKKVWNELLKIPYGSMVTYGELATGLNIKSAQAIGQAVGHNPISIIIPCLPAF